MTYRLHDPRLPPRQGPGRPPGKEPGGSVSTAVKWIAAAATALAVGIAIGFLATPSFKTSPSSSADIVKSTSATTSAPNTLNSAPNPDVPTPRAPDPHIDFAAWIGPADEPDVASSALIYDRQGRDLGEGIPTDDVRCAPGYEPRALTEVVAPTQRPQSTGIEAASYPGGARWGALPGNGMPLGGNPVPFSRSMQRYLIDFRSAQNMPNTINRDNDLAFVVIVFQLGGVGDMRVSPVELPAPSAEFRFVEFSAPVIVRGAYSCLRT